METFFNANANLFVLFAILSFCILTKMNTVNQNMPCKYGCSLHQEEFILWLGVMKQIRWLDKASSLMCYVRAIYWTNKKSISFAFGLRTSEDVLSEDGVFAIFASSNDPWVAGWNDIASSFAASSFGLKTGNCIVSRPQSLQSRCSGPLTSWHFSRILYFALKKKNRRSFLFRIDIFLRLVRKNTFCRLLSKLA